MKKYSINSNLKMFSEYHGAVILIEGKVITINKDCEFLLNHFNELQDKYLSEQLKSITVQLVKENILLEERGYHDT